MNSLIIRESQTVKSVLPKIIVNEPMPFRPHHWLCLPGYKGYSYDKTHKTNWDYLSQMLLLNPYTKVKIVTEEDNLCIGCPNSKIEKGKCMEVYVKALDKTVINILELIEGGIYIYGEQLGKLRKILTPEKHAQICGDCEWRQLGLCKDTFERHD